MVIYNSIVSLLEQNIVPFRTIKHLPEGNTFKASAIRGHSISQAAKAMVTYIEREGSRNQYILAVVPGDRKVNMKLLGRIFDAKKAQFATPSDARRLTGCEMGAVPPISFCDDLVAVFDEDLLKEEEIVFNAGRLDISIVVETRRILAVSTPLVRSISMDIKATG